MKHDKNQPPCGLLAYVWKDIVRSDDGLLWHLLPSRLGGRLWPPS